MKKRTFGEIKALSASLNRIVREQIPQRLEEAEDPAEWDDQLGLAVRRFRKLIDGMEKRLGRYPAKGDELSYTEMLDYERLEIIIQDLG